MRLGYAMNHGGDPYGVLPAVPGLSLADVFGFHNTATVAYLPFWPILTGLIYLLYSLVGWNNRFFYYFLLKQPVILGDVGLAFLIFSYVRSRKTEKAALWALSFWLFSPFTIILSGVWGMFDSLAISLVFLAITSTSRAKKALWEGLAIFAKSIPIIYAAPLMMRRPRDLWAPLLSIGLAGLLSMATFAIMKWPLSIVTSTVESTAFKGDWSMSAWDIVYYTNYLGLLPNLGSWVYRILGILWVPAIILFTWVSIKRFGRELENGVIQSLLVCTLVFLIFKARVTEQYALYLFALATVDVALIHPERKRLLFATIGVAMVFLVVNNFFFVRFLSPIYPGFVGFENAMYATIGLTRFAVMTLSGTAFTCLNIKYLFELLRRH